MYFCCSFLLKLQNKFKIFYFKLNIKLEQNLDDVGFGGLYSMFHPIIYLAVKFIQKY